MSHAVKLHGNSFWFACALRATYYRPGAIVRKHRLVVRRPSSSVVVVKNLKSLATLALAPGARPGCGPQGGCCHFATVAIKK